MVDDLRKLNADVRVIFQMIKAYLLKILLKPGGIINLLLCAIFMAPFTLLGMILCKVLPAIHNLFLSQVVLARK